MTDQATLNEDWLRTRTWDVRCPNHELAVDLPGLLAALGVTAASYREQQERVRAFTGLPAWRAAPSGLRYDVEGWLQQPLTVAGVELKRAGWDAVPRDENGRWSIHPAQAVEHLLDLQAPAPPHEPSVGRGAERSGAGIGVYDDTDPFTPEHRAKMEKALEAHHLTRRVAADRLEAIASRSADVETDAHWYHDAHEQLHALAVEHHMDVSTVAGVTAAMSPLNDWAGNVEDARQIVAAWDENPPITVTPADVAAVATHDRASKRWRQNPLDLGPYVGTRPLREYPPNVVAAVSALRPIGLPRGVGYRNSLEKALRIAGGEHPGDVLSGPKVRSFYSDLLVPTDGNTVTVDTHMVRAMMDNAMLDPKELQNMLRVPSAERETGVSFDVGTYPVMAEAVRDAAAVFQGGRFRPSEFQAIVWRQWQREHPATERRAASRHAFRTGQRRRNAWQEAHRSHQGKS